MAGGVVARALRARERSGQRFRPQPSRARSARATTPHGLPLRLRPVLSTDLIQSASRKIRRNTFDSLKATGSFAAHFSGIRKSLPPASTKRNLTRCGRFRPFGISARFLLSKNGVRRKAGYSLMTLRESARQIRGAAEEAWVAQLVEHVLGKDEVAGSIPVPGSSSSNHGVSFSAKAQAFSTNKQTDQTTIHLTHHG